MGGWRGKLCEYMSWICKERFGGTMNVRLGIWRGYEGVDGTVERVAGKLLELH